MATDVQVSAESNAELKRSHVARRIASEVRYGPSDSRISSTTSLLHAFRVHGVHTGLTDVVEALEAEGLAVDTGGWPEIPRRGVVALELSGTGETREVVADGRPSIRMSVWGPGRAPSEERALPPYATPDPTDVLLFDVDPLPDDVAPGAIEGRVREITDQLNPWCPDLDELMVRDLLTPDVQPKVETYGDERAGVRSVSVVAVIARETPCAADEFDGVSQQLIFQMVEMVVGPGWILTCWHPSQVFAGSGEGHVGPPVLREPFLSHVAHRWLRDEEPIGKTRRTRTSGDLGLYLARALVHTYGASLRMMERWVSTWEVDFYRSLSCDDKPKRLKAAAGEISNFLSMVGEFHRRLSAFRLAAEEMPGRSWFPATSHLSKTSHAEETHGDPTNALAASVETADQRLTHLSTAIRADMDLLMIQSQATQQESSERLQAYLGKVTGLVLVPTLVAGLFGANTALPGGGSWMGFDIMVLLMILSGVAVYLAIRKLI